MKLIHDFKYILDSTHTTAIFVSHDLLEMKSLTHQLFILMNGELVQHGNTNDVINHPNEAASPFINEWKSLLPIKYNDTLKIKKCHIYRNMAKM